MEKLDKLQHEMYWNFIRNKINRDFIYDKLQHEMYWNDISALYTVCESLINYNMRCIETNVIPYYRQNYYDKLQHEMYWNCI